jgi:hypothetical protein
MKRLALGGLLFCIVVLVTKVFAYPTLNSFLTVYPFSTGQTLTELHSGRIVTNLGAMSLLTVNLPPALEGLHFVVSLSAAQQVDVNPQTGDQIIGLTDNAGDAIRSGSTIGTTVELVALDSTKWLAIRTIGTWTDVN